MTVDEALAEVEAMKHPRPGEVNVILDQLRLMKQPTDVDGGYREYIKIEIGKCQVSDWVARVITNAGRSKA